MPLLAVVGLAVLFTLGQPVLFRQQRVGRDGAVFEMLKFRTMSGSRETDASADWDLSSDRAPGGVEGPDRRTQLGKLLRRTCIDELPQLVNVAKGKMSLVGPRPERPDFVSLFERGVYRYGDRHRVKSGITGWAQINGLRGQTSLSDRVEWDNFYIDNWSLGLDAKILLMTLPMIWRFKSASE
jgi:lipopolysaccharide/colanic/teichoic acid biosynthesis glycosyltransferase